MIPTCTQCGKEKPESRVDPYCAECRRARNIKWRTENPEKHLEMSRRHKRDAQTRAKLEFVQAYGGKCTCCGESEIHFLTIEHLTPEGLALHKWPNGKRMDTLTTIRRLKKAGWPDYVTVLCMNCNYAKGMFGFCPHDDLGTFPIRFPGSFPERRYPGTMEG